MTTILDSLMSGGYTRDDDMDMATEFDLWIEEKEAEAKNMSIDELNKARFDAIMTDQHILVDLYETELSKREPKINTPAPSNIDEDWFYGQVNIERPKVVEQDELPF